MSAAYPPARELPDLIYQQRRAVAKAAELLLGAREAAQAHDWRKARRLYCRARCVTETPSAYFERIES